MEKIILTVPYWDVENQPERKRNIGYAVQSLKSYAEYHNRNASFYELEIMPVNLGVSSCSDYPNDFHIPHITDYAFDKPTRMNSLFLYLYEKGVKWVGMVDPDLILFDNGYHDLFLSIEQQLEWNTMLTYSFVRTKPQLRELLPNWTYNTLSFHTHPLILEARDYYEDWKVCGGAFFMSLERFVSLGGFNEDFRVYGFDDVDFTQRFLLNGGEVISTPTVMFYHLWHPTVIQTSTVDEIERYEYELKYWRLHREVFKVEIEKPIDERRKLQHTSPRFSNYCYGLNDIEFSYDHGKHPITSFPLAFQRQMGLVNDDVFYSIN